MAISLATVWRGRAWLADPKDQPLQRPAVRSCGPLQAEVAG